MKSYQFEMDTRIASYDPFDDRLILTGKWFDFAFCPRDGSGQESSVSTTFDGVSRSLKVFSTTQRAAERGIRLLLSSIGLVDGHVPHNSDYLDFLPSFYNRDPYLFNRRATIARIGVLEAAVVATKASFRKHLISAVHKYELACRTHSNDAMQLGPFEEHSPLAESFDDDKIRYAYAILIHYSILEELGFDIHASPRNPSKLPNGAWNPSVRADLVDRLEKGHVDTSDPILWAFRGPPTKIEIRKPIDVQKRAPWSGGPVRDAYIRIEDAIATVSWIRSRIAAHKAKDGIESLSVYDVFNANSLSRHLLLSNLRVTRSPYWRWGQ